MEAELDYSNYIGFFKPPTSDFTFTPRFEDKEDEEWNKRLQERIAEGYKPPVIIDAYEDTEEFWKEAELMLAAEAEQIANGTHPCFLAPPRPDAPPREPSFVKAFLAGDMDVVSSSPAECCSPYGSSHSRIPSDDMEMEGSDDEDTEVGMNSSPAPSSPSSTLVDIKDESSSGPSPRPSSGPSPYMAPQMQKGARKRARLHKNVDDDYSENDVESDPEDEGSPSKKARTSSGGKRTTARKVAKAAPHARSDADGEADNEVEERPDPVGHTTKHDTCKLHLNQAKPARNLEEVARGTYSGGKKSMDGRTSRLKVRDIIICYICGLSGKASRRHVLEHSDHIGVWAKHFFRMGTVKDPRNRYAIIHLIFAMIFDTMAAGRDGKAIIEWSVEEEQARVEFLAEYGDLTEFTPEIADSFVFPEALRQRLHTWVTTRLAPRSCTKTGCSQILARNSARIRHETKCRAT